MTRQTRPKSRKLVSIAVGFLALALGVLGLLAALTLLEEGDALSQSRPERASSGTAVATAAARPSPAAEQTPPEERLPGPDRASLRASGLMPPRKGRPRETGTRAQALYFRTRIHRSPSTGSGPKGVARRGTRIAVVGSVKGSGCAKGTWYLLAGRGYACTRRGFAVSSRRKDYNLHYSLPDTRGLLPYRYAKVVEDGAPRLYRIPTLDEDKLIERAAEAEEGWPEVVEKAMEGAYFFTIHDTHEDHGRRYVRSVRGRYARAEHVRELETPPMHGELLGRKGGHRLPLAFVWGEDRPLWRLEGAELRRVGTAEKHARFAPGRIVTVGGKRFVSGPDGVLVARDHVRIARRVRRPEQVSSGGRWIHVNLSQQTLVAYRGDRPLLATLVSSGVKGFEPPLGTFQIHKKYISVTMNGPDPDKGWYEVEEVPWTMYYWESYAVHGTYWHNEFGKPRSHGCTNVAPADARWLFYWTTPRLPADWHAIEDDGGTTVHYTTDDDADAK